MFAVITPALISGAFAERMKFSAYLAFTMLWATFVYDPVAHWVWAGGFLSAQGVLDFAGGAVVPVDLNAGLASYPANAADPDGLFMAADAALADAVDGGIAVQLAL